ncbi:putative GPI-anchored adhesin-like protein PGA55 isoform X2 [Penaeus vannamei]|uniref:Putative GPI-anchored adhesin-like protein PGA55 isoform X2 n=1 Tax=Penaeus vannamei TaxID=6689 RepID=A0A423TE82_PENVA|nr:putative GPI-anchored adhesin-like protein PGA55 isoform X2 [Penaeus vannamei]
MDAISIAPSSIYSWPHICILIGICIFVIDQVHPRATRQPPPPLPPFVYHPGATLLLSPSCEVRTQASRSTAIQLARRPRPPLPPWGSGEESASGSTSALPLSHPLLTRLTSHPKSRILRRRNGRAGVPARALLHHAHVALVFAHDLGQRDAHQPHWSCRRPRRSSQGRRACAGRPRTRQLSGRLPALPGVAGGQQRMRVGWAFGAGCGRRRVRGRARGRSSARGRPRRGPGRHQPRVGTLAPRPAAGFTLAQLGEVSGCHMTTVPQSQFTPLGDALCWVIHRLRETAGVAEAEAVRASLSAHFPSLVLPDAELVHAALSTLIRQRKVYHNGATYGIVQPLDAFYQPLVHAPADRLLPRDAPAAPAADEAPRDGLCHAAVQTDLAELITGSAGPRDAVLRPSKGERGSMLSKLLRVSPRNRLASFSAQFPPPAWSDPAPPATTTHLHCVATQTTSQKPQVEQWWMATPSWSPRSSTLPRRLQRPRSSTPPTSRNSSTPPLLPNNFQYMRESSNPMASSLPLSLVSTTPALLSEEELVLHASPGHRPAPHRSPIHHPSPHSSPGHRSSHGSPAHRSSHHSSHSSPSHRPQPQGTPAHHQHILKEFVEDHPPGLSPSSRNPESRANLKNHKHRSPARAVGECKTPPIPVTDNRLSYRDLESSPGRSRKDQGARKAAQDGEWARKEAKESAIKQCKEGHNKKSGETKARKSGKEQQDRAADGESSHQEKRRHQHGNKGRHQKECFHSQEMQRKRQENIQNEENQDCGRYDRSALQLDLPHSHMNNSRKVNASPQRPEGLKNNVLHHNNSLANISKGSCSDLTARNLGYTEVDKCHKKLCSQTLDQLSQHAPADKTPASSPGETRPGKLDNIISTEGKEPDPKAREDDTNKTNSSSSPDAENVSVKTYPSLSELNFNFGSLAAQRILCGASVNSLDTLVEVNLAAEKRKLQRKHSSPATPVTNTDLGFV